jgi:hypothetical protein
MQFPEPTLTQEFLSGFIETWRLWVPLLLLLVWVGWATRRWWGGRLLLLSLIILCAFAAKVTLTEQARGRATIEAWNKLRVPLPQTAKIDGLQLAAGTMVRWDKERDGHLLTAELGTGQEVSPGMVLVGEVDLLWAEFWRGTLARKSVLRGWTCSTGKVDVHTSGELRWCVLADPQKTEAGVVPPRTAVLLDPGEPSDALLHLPNVGMRANPGNFWIAPDAWFSMYSDGELSSIPGPITRRGVTLGSEDYGVVLRYGEDDVTRWYGGDLVPTPPTLARPPGSVTGWRGDLASSLTCEGEHRIEKGSRVTIPTSGDVVTTTHWDSSRPKAKPVLDSFHCDLGPAD